MQVLSLSQIRIKALICHKGKANKHEGKIEREGQASPSAQRTHTKRLENCFSDGGFSVSDASSEQPLKDLADDGDSCAVLQRHARVVREQG